MFIVRAFICNFTWFLRSASSDQEEMPLRILTQKPRATSPSSRSGLHPSIIIASFKTVFSSALAHWPVPGRSVTFAPLRLPISTTRPTTSIARGLVPKEGDLPLLPCLLMTPSLRGMLVLVRLQLPPRRSLAGVTLSPVKFPA